MMAYGLFLALQSKSGDKVTCDFTWYKHHDSHNGPELEKIFDIEQKCLSGFFAFVEYSPRKSARILKKILLAFHILKYVRASSFKYNYSPSVLSKRGNVIYKQAWTSYKYFCEVEEEIRESFTFPALDFRNLELLKMINDCESVAVHVRRGDYIGSSSHVGLCGEEYFKNAISYILIKLKAPTFFIFSDDIDWSKKHLSIDRVFYIDWNKGGESYRDMQLMSLCEHNVISHSSFSFWSAYLNDNPDKIVVAPERWANPESGVELNDMNMPEWVVLKNY